MLAMLMLKTNELWRGSKFSKSQFPDSFHQDRKFRNLLQIVRWFFSLRKILYYVTQILDGGFFNSSLLYWFSALMCIFKELLSLFQPIKINFMKMHHSVLNVCVNHGSLQNNLDSIHSKIHQQATGLKFS